MTEAFDPKIARYFYVARTVHLERQAKYRPGWFFYTRTRADFDEQLAARTRGVMKASAWQVARFVVREGVRVLEMPEALAVPVWPQALIVQSAVLFHNAIRPRRDRISIVTYAIENLSPVEKIRGRLALPAWCAAAIVNAIGGYLLRSTDRVVFGTQAALETYQGALPRAMRRQSLDVQLVWALPTRGEYLETETRRPQLAFLGTFEERKGIRHLLRAWPLVKAALPEASLRLIGKAGDIDTVRAFVAANEDIELIEDPPRAAIFELLRESKALVLFSQPTPVWKEQVGLPILEALSQGCEIVTSDQTGIAEWLVSAGHRVLSVSASTDELARAITNALRSQRSPAEIVADLPEEDTRQTADAALFATLS